jgi:hypothetical protein
MKASFTINRNEKCHIFVCGIYMHYDYLELFFKIGLKINVNKKALISRNGHFIGFFVRLKYFFTKNLPENGIRVTMIALNRTTDRLINQQ